MQKERLKQEWLNVEQTAQIKGWDFTIIESEYKETNPPWDYKQIIEKYIKINDRLLDIDTGGGEFLQSFNHPYDKISATEGWKPNVHLCEQTLKPIGIDFHEVQAGSVLPFGDETFDLVINRHGTLNLEEIYRVLKRGGILITQQVGAENDRALIQKLLPGLPLQYENQYLEWTVEACQNVGFQIIEADESHMPIRFYTTKALVWFAKVIEWEFSGFSVEKCIEQLYQIEKQVEQTGYIEGKSHRYIVVVRK